MLTGLGINTTSTIGAIAISLIGLTNIKGTLLAGYLGERYSKKYLLAGICTSRTIITTAFYLASNDTNNGNLILDWHGQLVVGDIADHFWAYRTSLWDTVCGNTLRNHIFLASVWVFLRGLVGRCTL